MTENLPSGYSMEVLEDADGEKLKKNYFMFTDGVMKIQPEGWILPTNFTRHSEKIYDNEIKPSDIFVLTYPKSGTTWMQEIVWNLKFNPNLDNEEAKISLDLRFPNFEAGLFFATTGALLPKPDGDPMRSFNQLLPGKERLDEGSLAALTHKPRMMKNHLPLSLLPPAVFDLCKSVYVARDPRDVISSLFHYMRLQILYGFRGTLDEFVDDVVNDRVIFGPYFKHVKLAWEKRNEPNFCFVFYEDMKHDIVSQIKRVDKLLGTNRDENQIQNIARHTSFSKMKERFKDNQPSSHNNTYFNKKVEQEEGGFFRKGQIGDWKSRFTPEQANKLNDWMAKNLVQFGDDFKYKV